jgi:hypothetical protein
MTTSSISELPTHLAVTAQHRNCVRRAADGQPETRRRRNFPHPPKFQNSLMLVQVSLIRRKKFPAHCVGNCHHNPFIWLAFPMRFEAKIP